MMVWTEAIIAKLRAGWIRGDSTIALAQEIGVSKNAIVGKVHRIGLDPRPSPIIRDGIRQPLKVQPPRPLKTLPPLASDLPRAEPVRPSWAAPIPPVIAPPKPEPRRNAPSCCWPIGEPGTKAFRFCDGSAIAGKPYCDEHARKAVVKIRNRREDAELAHAVGGD